MKSKNSNVSHRFLWIKNPRHPLLKPWRSAPCSALRWSRENSKGERAKFRDGPKHVPFFWEIESLGIIQDCNSVNSSMPLRTRTRIKVSFFLNDSCKVFWTQPFPFLNADLDRIEFPIRSSLTMSPVWRKSPVHSSMVEVPLRHSMERTVGEKEIRESQERSLTREGEGEGERDIGKWKMSLTLCLSLVFIDDFVFGWQENLRKIEKVTTSFFFP